MGRTPRTLHPGAWWVWALGLAVAASRTTNIAALALLIVVAAFVVAVRRGDHLWARSFRLYLWLGLMIVVLRLAFRILLNDTYGGQVLLWLPTIPLPGWIQGIHILGPVTTESLLSGLGEGVQLAAIVICVGAANSLADPKRLLKSMPPALYEIGTTLVVAVTVLPQLAESLGRVRMARRLRGVRHGRVRGLRALVVPVLEDALERSMLLAAGMDARGYGRSGDAGPGRRRLTGALMLIGLVGICMGSYASLDQTSPRWLAGPMLVLGLVVAAAGLLSAGSRVRRTRYRPDPWRVAETGVAASGIAVAAAFMMPLAADQATLNPDVTLFPPPVTATMLLACLVGLAAAFAPPPQLVEPGRVGRASAGTEVAP